MQTTKADIQVKREKEQIDTSALSDVIFVEDSDELYVVSKITLSGQYNRVYNVVSCFVPLNNDRVCIDGDLLLIGLFSDLVIFDLKQDKLLRVAEFDCWGICGIYRFKSGYFLHGEGTNYFLDKDFNILWEESYMDLFVNCKVEKYIEQHDDYIAVYDWLGHKHYYDEKGEYMREYFPEYDHNRDDRDS